MNPQKKMYKVLSPIEKKGGGTYWMRMGSAYTNRDDSINLYLDAVPAPNSSSHRYELQIRELTEEDLRKRESFASAGGASSNGASGSFARDLGGIGGGPTRDSRAVTASAGTGEDVPF